MSKQAPLPPPGTGTDRALMTCSEVASLLRLSRMTVYRMAENGTLEGQRFGRSLRITRTSVKKLMGEAWPAPAPGE